MIAYTYTKPMYLCLYLLHVKPFISCLSVRGLNIHLCKRLLVNYGICFKTNLLGNKVIMHCIKNMCLDHTVMLVNSYVKLNIKNSGQSSLFTDKSILFKASSISDFEYSHSFSLFNVTEKTSYHQKHKHNTALIIKFCLSCQSISYYSSLMNESLSY